VEFDAAFGAVIDYRRALDGKLHAHDDSPQLVYGDGGLLQLVDLWGIADSEGEVRWPENDQEWAQAQRACDSTMKIISGIPYLRRPKIPIQEYPDVRVPMGRVHIDLMGELPETDGNKSKYIMVVKDFHTKFVWLFAIRTKDAVAVADQLVMELYCRWGIPEMLIHNRGTEFRNKLAKRIGHIFRVNKISTTPYNAWSNGCMENHNRTMKDQLYHFVESRQKDWDIFLPTVQFMYNTTVNSATGYTPYYLMFGGECNMPGIGGLVNRSGEAVRADEGEVDVGRVDKSIYETWVEGLLSSLQLAWEVTTLRAHENAARGNKAATLKAGLEFKEYAVGDMFYRKRNQVRTFRSVQEKETYKINVKLAARFEGPYKVVRKVNAMVYVAEIDGEQKRIHAVNMKPGVRANQARRAQSG
jgi:hypothetical protein